MSEPHDLLPEAERERIFAAADEAFEAGDFDRALRALAALGEADAGRWYAEAEILEELGDVRGAEENYRRAGALVGADDSFHLLAWGSFLLAQWRLDEARSALERLREGALDAVAWAAALERRALLAELDGEYERADALFARAHAASEEHPAPPPRMDPDAFRAVVEEAALALPEEFQSAFEHVAVVIDPMPTAAILEAPESGFGPETLGLYTGMPLVDFLSTGGGGLPPTIHLFQRNLERATDGPDDLREQIRITLWHELGHALGFDEDEVDAMGLG